MATPIVLPASESQDALLDAIGVATNTGAPLQLGPGTHFTMVRRDLEGDNTAVIRKSQPAAPRCRT
jgi:hypothetical protein